MGKYTRLQYIKQFYHKHTFNFRIYVFAQKSNQRFVLKWGKVTKEPNTKNYKVHKTELSYFVWSKKLIPFSLEVCWWKRNGENISHRFWGRFETSGKLAELWAIFPLGVSWASISSIKNPFLVGADLPTK